MRYITISIILFLTLFTLPATHAQSSLELMDIDFLYVSAHPDDEGGFTGTMARYNLDEGYRGTIATFTLGQGGGNAIGPEVGQSLGLIRYEELRKSLSYAGVDRFYYLGFQDFYFTQSAGLTDKKWSEQDPDYLCKLIRVVRLTRPEVLVTMWPGPGTHGHHQLAARSAIRAFNLSDDPNTCPTQITDEYLEPWQPLKLYISAPDDRSSIEVPLDEFSRSAGMTYANLRSIALRNFRTQGWDRWNTVPAGRTGSEDRLLVKSLVPVGHPETHFLEGTHLPAGSSPPGVLLKINTDSYNVSSEKPLTVHTKLANETDLLFEDVSVELVLPEGWKSGDYRNTIDMLKSGESSKKSFEIIPERDITENEPQQIWVKYTATIDGNPISGVNYTWVEPSPPIQVQVKPLFDIQYYREFARETDTEWLTPNLPTRLPLVVNEVNPVTVQVSNSSEDTLSGEISFEFPEGISASGDLSFTLKPGESRGIPVTVKITGSVLHHNQHSAVFNGKVIAQTTSYTDSEEINMYALPTLSVSKAEEKPEIDGDLRDMTDYSSATVSFEDTWSGQADGNEDASSDFHLSYDEEHLYVGVRVYDNNVLCHMPPNRIRNHWYGDAIELTIDPSGESTDVSTTFRASIFPCSTEGFEPNAARYGDANSGAISETAPAMKVASSQTEDGYIIEMAIPWHVMPHQPESKDRIRFNLLVYDADAEDPETGGDYGKSRIGWGSVVGAQQATTYLWPTVTLE